MKKMLNNDFKVIKIISIVYVIIFLSIIPIQNLSAEWIKFDPVEVISLEVVSTSSTNFSWSPALTIDDLDNIHIIWNEWGGVPLEDDYILYKCWNASLETWSDATVLANASTYSTQCGSIKADSSGNIHVCWSDITGYGGSGSDSDICYRYWNATLDEWNTTEVISTESTSASHDPSLDIDSEGNIYIAWNDYSDYNSSDIDADIFYKCWDVDSESWNSTTVLTTYSVDMSWDPCISIDESDVIHIVWSEFDALDSSGIDLDIFHTYRNSSINSWSYPKAVSTSSTEDSWYAFISTDDSGNVYSVWDDDTDFFGYAEDEYNIMYNTWDSTSGEWSSPEIIFSVNDTFCENPILALDTLGNVHLTWESNNISADSGIDIDIGYTYRNATTNDWSDVILVSEGSNDRSSLPFIGVDSKGFVQIVWQDSFDYL
ncbi:MAG: hypothetical protein ACTSPF_08775, partial [Candidatus Heimdallarchaeaceae archaeon]